MAIFIQIWSIASQKHLTDVCFRSVFTHILHSRFLCLHSMCFHSSVYLPVACSTHMHQVGEGTCCTWVEQVPSPSPTFTYLLHGWNQLSSCPTLVSDGSQLFIMCRSASSNLNVSHHGNRLVSPTGGVSFSVSKPDIHVLCIGRCWQDITK